MKFMKQVDCYSLFWGIQELERLGVTGDAKVTLKINENIPKNLYYKLSPVNVSDNLTENKEIIVDNDVLLNNNISTRESIYSGTI